MSSLPFYAENVSKLAKSFKSQANADGIEIGHNQILNYLAKATNHQNYQAWLAASEFMEAPALCNDDILSLADELLAVGLKIGDHGHHDKALELISIASSIKRGSSVYNSLARAADSNGYGYLDELLELLGCKLVELPLAVRNFRLSSTPPMSQSELADSLGLGIAAIAKIESGDFKPSVLAVRKLVVFLKQRANPRNFEIGKRVRAARRHAGITKQKMASELGVSKDVYISIESGTADPSEYISLLSTILNTSADELLSVA